jgi:L-aspartate oxidase
MRFVDFLVVGGGVAGLSAAAGLADSGSVLVVTKESLAESNTAYAQGGIAVALGGQEDVTLHLSDTIGAGDGLVNAASAAVLIEQGPQRVSELIEWGTGFDRYPASDLERAGQLMRTREGAHSLARILHANGDATGHEIAASLLRHVRTISRIELMEWTTMVELIVHSEAGQADRVVGAMLLDAAGVLQKVYARAVLLATGGAGQIYSDTTNPSVATGDGIAAAYRAGAELMDMEFYQFHPTAFALDGAPRFLLSEALRGEGAWLVNARGERFMHRYHPGLELAPRDVVARAITREGVAGPVYLDLREAGKSLDLKARFPGISAFLADYGLELALDQIPVRPAAHYLMGGIRTDVQGRTSLAGLYAAGEAACTGVHGANRLASNSLLEGLVFGALAAEAMAKEQAPDSKQQESPVAHSIAMVLDDSADVEAWIAQLQRLMWDDAGLLRDEAGLQRATASLIALRASAPKGLARRALEARNLLTVADAIVQSALGRRESRGAHYRLDFPSHDALARHSLLRQSKLRFTA